MWKTKCWIALSATLPLGSLHAAQEREGSIRGVVYDKDFEAPLSGAQVTIVETQQKALTGEQGNFVLGLVKPGRYTLLFSKDGYVRQIRTDVVVAPGQLTDLDAFLSGEFTDMDEFVVQDVLHADGGTEIGLLELRFESPALLDSISAELMSRAGASDAASALRLVSGASIQDGKFAVIRGLPDRYVSSQMNGVRLPSADEDKRAVELDQFPAAVIESLQVSKTFTPDQQGDASGGAVDLRLKGIPDELMFQISGQVSYNSQVAGRSNFLTYDGGGVNTWGRDDGDRDIQYDNLASGGNWDGAVGVSRDEAPIDHKWALATGGKYVLDNGLKIGGSLSAFYERDSSYYDNGIDDSYWVESPGAGLTPKYEQGTPSQDDFKTSLFDVTQAAQSVKWGSLMTLGVESDDHAVGLTYLYTRTAEDKATLAEDTRGKAYFFPGYDPYDPAGPGNAPSELSEAPYLRLETLEYTERTTGTLQLRGSHRLPLPELGVGGFKFLAPELDWTLAASNANLYQPDKRQFGSLWHGPSLNPGAPPFIPPFTDPAKYLPFLPDANFNLGNLQRIWKEIDEESEQYSLNLSFPFEQWSGERGYAKFGVFGDAVDRKFDQESFSNIGDGGATYLANFDEFWSAVFPFDDPRHPLIGSTQDVDYRGEQNISAWYGMSDLPLNSRVNVIGGARVESTEISIVNDPEADALWVEPGHTAATGLNPGEADVAFDQRDILPSIGVVVRATDQLTLRGSFSQTVARQTFKELTPIQQQEYAGGPIFLGNPDLTMSSLDNYDVRADYVPYEGALLSLSLFHKDIDDPIEYVQRISPYDHTSAVNYPEGKLNGLELEVRQQLDRFWDPLQGFAFGANATFLDARVSLPADEIAAFNSSNVLAPASERDMTNAPEYLYNLYLTYDPVNWGTQLALFYTVQGDTLVAGAGVSVENFYVPDVYAKQYDTLNFSLTQKLGRYFKLQFQAKNLTNPDLEEVYRSKYTGDDVTKTSYSKGIEYSLTLGAQFSF